MLFFDTVYTQRALINYTHSFPTYHIIPYLLSTQEVKLHPAIHELASRFPPFITTEHQIPGTNLPVIPGSGLTRRFVSSLPSEFPCTGVILEYVLEGDNRADAALLASALARSLSKELGITGNGTCDVKLMPSSVPFVGSAYFVPVCQSHGKSPRVGDKGYLGWLMINPYLASNVAKKCCKMRY